MDKVHIDLGVNSYDIVIGYNLPFAKYIKEVLPKTKDLLIVTNETIAPLYLNSLQNSLEQEGFNCTQCILADGEQFKNVDSYMQIMGTLLSNNMARDCALIALGGGVVGDITGFAAATYQRGVKFIQIPTTLLAMVDSSVGGKTAINHPLGKNMIGAFYQPKLVLADINMLNTLDQRQIAAGMAEVIKYGVILDKPFFDYLLECESYNNLDLIYVVKQCCLLKAKVVMQDEKEQGLRALLNYGHTFGHAIEVGAGFGMYLHGEAVAIGMLVAAFVAKHTKGLTQSDFDLILQIIKSYNLPYTIPQNLTASDFIAHMYHDKKVKAGRINYVLPTSIGKVQVFNDLDDNLMLELLKDFCVSIV